MDGQKKKGKSRLSRTELVSYGLGAFLGAMLLVYLLASYYIGASLEGYARKQLAEAPEVELTQWDLGVLKSYGEVRLGEDVPLKVRIMVKHFPLVGLEGLSLFRIRAFPVLEGTLKQAMAKIVQEPPKALVKGEFFAGGRFDLVAMVKPFRTKATSPVQLSLARGAQLKWRMDYGKRRSDVELFLPKLWLSGLHSIDKVAIAALRAKLEWTQPGQSSLKFEASAHKGRMLLNDKKLQLKRGSLALSLKNIPLDLFGAAEAGMTAKTSPENPLKALMKAKNLSTSFGVNADLSEAGKVSADAQLDFTDVSTVFVTKGRSGLSGTGRLGVAQKVIKTYLPEFQPLAQEWVSSGLLREKRGMIRARMSLKEGILKVNSSPIPLPQWAPPPKAPL